ASGARADDMTARLAIALERELAELDAQLDATHPDDPVPGFRVVLTGSGRRSDDDRLAVRWLARLVGTGRSLTDDTTGGHGSESVGQRR
ncbi:MAG: hypothetical protein ACTJHU_06395, partial [Mycetocola sp.]